MVEKQTEVTMRSIAIFSIVFCLLFSGCGPPPYNGDFETSQGVCVSTNGFDVDPVQIDDIINYTVTMGGQMFPTTKRSLDMGPVRIDLEEKVRNWLWKFDTRLYVVKGPITACGAPDNPDAEILGCCSFHFDASGITDNQIIIRVLNSPTGCFAYTALAHEVVHIVEGAYYGKRWVTGNTNKHTPEFFDGPGSLAYEVNITLRQNPRCPETMEDAK